MAVIKPKKDKSLDTTKREINICLPALQHLVHQKAGNLIAIIETLTINDTKNVYQLNSVLFIYKKLKKDF